MSLWTTDQVALIEEAQYALSNVLTGIELTDGEASAILTVQELLDDLLISLDEEM